MIHGITLEELRSEIRYQGFTLEEGEDTLCCTKQRRTRVTKSFTLPADPRLEPEIAKYLVIMQAYYWVRGYDLCYHADRTFKLTMGKQHPGFERHVKVAKTFAYGDYYDLDQVILALSCWIVEANLPWQRRQYWRFRHYKRFVRFLHRGWRALPVFCCKELGEN